MLKDISLLKGLSDSQLEALDSDAEKRNYKKI